LGSGRWTMYLSCKADCYQAGSHCTAQFKTSTVEVYT
jgi:hypothetical protein